MFGTTWYENREQDIYHNKYYLGYRARYSVTNQTNAPVDYRYYVIKWRRDIPDVGVQTNTLDYENIMNVAGAYLAKISAPTITSDGDARNDALTFEAENFLTYPVIKDLVKVVRSGKFTLDAGDSRAVNISRKIRQINLLKMYPPITTGNGTLIESNYHWEKGDSMVLFRMFSRPADYADEEKDPEDALSTRTTPLSLLSYSCKYSAMKMTPLPTVTQLSLPSYGLQDTVDEAKINVIADTDVKATPEVRAV